MSGGTALGSSPLAHAQAEEEDSSPSEKLEDVGFNRNLAVEVSDNDSSPSNIDNEKDYELSTSSISEKASCSMDAEESNKTVRPVRPCCTQSLDDLGKHGVHFEILHKGRKLTKEQLSTVKVAEWNLTAAQREMLDRHQTKLTKEGREQSTASHMLAATPGPSSYIAKGKFVDQNQEIDDTKLDIEAQHKALET